MEFEWKIFPGFNTWQILRKIKNMMDEIQCDPEEFTGRIIFMSVFNDLEWENKEKDVCIMTSTIVSDYPKDFHMVIGHSSDLVLNK